MVCTFRFVFFSLLFLAMTCLAGCGGDDAAKAAPNPGDGAGPAAGPAAAGKTTPEESTPPAAFPGELAKALAEGKKKNALVMVELYDDVCPYCDMVQETLADKAVSKELEDVIHVQITPADEALIKAFKLYSSPSFLFFKPGGGHLAPFLEGFRSPKVFLAEVRNYKLRAAGKEPNVPIPEDDNPSYGKG